MEKISRHYVERIIIGHHVYFSSKNKHGKKGDFRNLHVEGFDFEEVNFEGAILGGAIFENCSFVNVNLSNVPFDNAVVKNCRFVNCSFYYGSLHEANILSSSFKNCSFLKTEAFSLEINDSEFIECDFNFFNLSDSKIFKTKFLKIKSRDKGYLYNNLEIDNLWS